MGFAQVRARCHRKLIRIEVDQKDIGEISKKANREKIVRYLKSIGFKHITLDLEGYRTGSMDIR